MRVYFGFVYIWFDRCRRMFYVGSHHGKSNDGYIGSSQRFKRAYIKRPQDFKRRIIQWNFINDPKITRILEERWLQMIMPEELGIRYYNLMRHAAGGNLLEGFSPERRHQYGINISTKLRGIKRSAVTKAKIITALRNRTDDTKRKLSEKAKTQIRGPELGLKISLAHSGRKLPEEHKQNIAKGLKGYQKSIEHVNALQAACLRRVIENREAKMSEQALRKMFVEKFRPYGVIDPIEVKITSGIADYSYVLKCRNHAVDGWCELKFLNQWPKKPGTPIRIPSLKLRQVLWQEKRHAMGGRVSTLLQVGRGTYLLLAAPVLRLVYDRKLTALELMLQARVCSTEGFPTIEVLEALTT